MAKFWLINVVRLGTTKLLPGEAVDDTLVSTAPIIAAGGLLWPQGDAGVDAAAASAQAAHKNRGANEFELTEIMQTAVDVAQGRRLLSGTATLVLGTATVTGVTLTPTAKITTGLNTPGGTLGVAYAAPSASRTATQFVINAVDTAGAVVTTDVSTVDWAIVDDGA
jgi:hypothetical protein